MAYVVTVSYGSCLIGFINLLHSGCRSGAIHHHDVRIPRHQIGVLSSHSQEVCGLEWSLDGKYLASGGNDNLVNIWDSSFHTSTSPLHSLTQHTAGVKVLTFQDFRDCLLDRLSQ